MASTYSTDLKLELMATGENAGTWGTKTNTNLNLVQQAIAGYEAINVASSDVALVMSNASISNARNMILSFTGTLAGNRVVTIPDSIEKFYILKDGTTHSGNTLTFKTVSGTGFTLDEGKIHAAYSDGTNINEVALDTLGGTIGTASIADDAVNNDKLANDAVNTDQIVDDAVTNAKVAADAVDTVQIVNDAVTAAKLQRKFTISTSSPSGGNDGDIWFKYS
tara:strand:+ start:1130 stop:1795 length:666 start_codon:yes stop_codon:yes gene_type:complete